MDDVRTLEHVRRRRRQARTTVGALILTRAAGRGAPAWTALRVAAADAGDAMADMTAAFEVAEMWERA
jgi:hypothetical protein